MWFCELSSHVMPLFALEVKATMESVKSLEAIKGADWTLDFKDPTGDEVRKDIKLNASEEEELEGSRGVANLVLSFKGKKGQGSVTVEEACPLLRAVSPDDQDFVPIMAFECRGVEPVAWTFAVSDLNRMYGVCLSAKQFRRIDTHCTTSFASEPT